MWASLPARPGAPRLVNRGPGRAHDRLGRAVVPVARAERQERAGDRTRSAMFAWATLALRSSRAAWAAVTSLPAALARLIRFWSSLASGPNRAEAFATASDALTRWVFGTTDEVDPVVRGDLGDVGLRAATVCRVDARLERGQAGAVAANEAGLVELTSRRSILCSAGQDVRLLTRWVSESRVTKRRLISQSPAARRRSMPGAGRSPPSTPGCRSDGRPRRRSRSWSRGWPR